MSARNQKLRTRIAAMRAHLDDMERLLDLEDGVKARTLKKPPKVKKAAKKTTKKVVKKAAKKRVAKRLKTRTAKVAKKTARKTARKVVKAKATARQPSERARYAPPPRL